MSYSQFRIGELFNELSTVGFAYFCLYWAKIEGMEHYIKYAFYGVLFIIYVVSQVRKMRKKAEEERASEPAPVKPVVAKQVTATSKTVFDYKGKREMKTREKKSILTHKDKEVERNPIVYKPVADEELIAEALLQDRRKEEKALKEDRKPLADEHLEPYMEQSKYKMNLDWLKDKNNLKKAFIASEVFQRRY
ncbi:MAG: hypothetical protein K0R51_2240 [Cytophagaceae bacterium]|nr:hypothetical protein [Cytophagaceae bacterium]